MNIVGLEKLSMVDYDGYAAATVFTAGCNLRCPYCQNAVLIGDVAPRPLPHDEILDYLRGRRHLLDAVCITGGEPTLTPHLADFLREVRALGYRTKLDTNGTRPATLRALVEDGLLDYVAMDVKAPAENYPALFLASERDASAVADSIRYLLTEPLDYEFRLTLVDELTDEGAILRLREELAGAKRFFLQKFADRGANLVDGLSAVPYERALAYAETLRGTIREVSLRGYT